MFLLSSTEKMWIITSHYPLCNSTDSTRHQRDKHWAFFLHTWTHTGRGRRVDGGGKREVQVLNRGFLATAHLCLVGFASFKIGFFALTEQLLRARLSPNSTRPKSSKPRTSSNDRSPSVPVCPRQLCGREESCFCPEKGCLVGKTFTKSKKCSSIVNLEPIFLPMTHGRPRPVRANLAKLHNIV